MVAAKFRTFRICAGSFPRLRKTPSASSASSEEAFRFAEEAFRFAEEAFRFAEEIAPQTQFGKTFPKTGVSF